MAPAGATYFPSLNKCLTGNERLISWKAAYRALCDWDLATDDAALQHFLTEDETTRLLAKAQPASRPNAASRSKFDSKVLPINATQSANGEYNLEEIKKDALWLSKVEDIEEAEALRITVVEWQERVADQLLATAGTGRTDAVDFNSEKVRRDRLLRVYLEEHHNLLKLRVELVSIHAVQQLPKTWIDELATKVAGSDQDLASSIATCVDEVEEGLRLLSDSSAWPAEFKEREELFGTSTLLSLVERLRLLAALLHIQQAKGITESSVVLKWFKIMDSSSFMQVVQGPPALQNTVETLQWLASIVSLSVLQLPKVIVRFREMVAGTGVVQYPNFNVNAYLCDDECIRQLNLIMYRTSHAGCLLASPAIYAWTIIALTLKDAAVTESRTREEQQRRLEDGSSDTEAGGSPSTQRRESLIPETEVEKKWDLFQEAALEEARNDPIEFFARAAVDGLDVYGVIPRLSTALTATYGSELTFATPLMARSALLNLIREGLGIIDYQASVIEALLAVLEPGSLTNVRGRALSRRLASQFLEDNESLRPSILEQAFARYPYELSPILRLCTTLTDAESTHRAGSVEIVKVLDNLETVTLMVPEHFRSYELENEEENTNAMKLTSVLPIFKASKDSFYGQSLVITEREMEISEQEGINSVLTIPSRTPGLVIKEDRPMVMQLQHPHSGLEYIGLLLSTFLPGSELAPASQHSAIDHQIASEIIALINALLSASSRQHEGVEEAKFVLGRVSNALPEGVDIIGVISQAFERELLAHVEQNADSGSLELAVACGEFFCELSFIFPERVWAALSRSSLVGLYSGGACALAAVVAGHEVQIGQYRFLAACVQMYARLVDDAVTGLVKRKSGKTKPGNRFDTPAESMDSTPERTINSVLAAYTRIVLDVYQNLSSWHFAVPEEKLTVSIALQRSFRQLLQWTYGLEEPLEPRNTDAGAKRSKERISALIVPAAEMVFDAFAAENGIDSMILASIGNAFTEGLLLSEEIIPIQLRASLTGQIRQSSETLSTILRTARTSAQPKRAFSLASELVKQMPTLAMLYATEHAWKAQLADLLLELVQALTCTEADPPSLLSGMSPEAAKSFMAVVSQLDRPLSNAEVEVKVWELLSAVLDGRQQWFAVYLLTGTLPKTRRNDGANSIDRTENKSLLSYALDELVNISRMNPKIALVMLRFVAVAQKAWIWATKSVRAHSDFLKNTLEWLEGLEAPSKKANTADSLLSAREQRMAAYLCDVLSVNLNAGLETGDKAVLRALAGKLTFLTAHAACVDTWNPSLHRNLAKNLRQRFLYCELADFKRTPANPASYGTDFYYDMEIATKVLSHQALAWQGNDDLRTQGYAPEVQRANANLSLVDAQTKLLGSWERLATTLAECVEQDDRLPPMLVKAAESCLRANAEANMEMPDSGDLLQTRAELSFVLVSKLVGVQAKDAAMKDLLPFAWDLVRSSPVDYDIATAPEDLAYYRLLLQILFLAIRTHVYIPLSTSAMAKSTLQPRATDPQEQAMPSLSAGTAGILVDIVHKIAAPAFRALCANLHTDLQLAYPSDFALISALLQSVLAVKGANIAYLQVAEVVASSNIVRGALSLFSWADQLAEIMDQDPVYGEIAINFLLTLSSVPAVAEHMALDGVLIQLSNANLSNYFRKPGGKGPFEEPGRMFTIWTEGFLPLCLNLLDAVGPPIAREVAIFLNSFPEQLKRAADAFQSEAPSRYGRSRRGDVTLGLMHEVHNLTVIARAIQSSILNAAVDGVDAADIPELQYDLGNARAEVEKLARTKRSLADKIVPGNEREWVWARTPVEGASDNKLQAMVFKEVRECLELIGGELT